MPLAYVVVHPMRGTVATEGAAAHEQVQEDSPRCGEGSDEPIGGCGRAARQQVRRADGGEGDARALAHVRTC